MKPREIRQNVEQELFRSRLDQIIDMNHQLVRLAARVNWSRLETVCEEAGDAVLAAAGYNFPLLLNRLRLFLLLLRAAMLSDKITAQA